MNFILEAIVCFGISANADKRKTCKVSGTEGLVEVTLKDIDKENGKATLLFSNDTGVEVNVQYYVHFTNADKNAGVKVGVQRIAPYGNASADVSIDERYDESVVSIKGEKCK